MSGLALPFLFNAAESASADHTSIKAYRPRGAYDRSSPGPESEGGPDGGDDGGGGGDSGGSGASGSW